MRVVAAAVQSVASAAAVVSKVHNVNALRMLMNDPTAAATAETATERERKKERESVLKISL